MQHRAIKVISELRHKPYQKRLQRFESNLRKHAFSQTIIGDWNSLTENIVNSESLDIWRGRLMNTGAQNGTE